MPILDVLASEAGGFLFYAARAVPAVPVLQRREQFGPYPASARVVKDRSCRPLSPTPALVFGCLTAVDGGSKHLLTPACVAHLGAFRRPVAASYTFIIRFCYTKTTPQPKKMTIILKIIAVFLYNKNHPYQRGKH